MIALAAAALFGLAFLLSLLAFLGVSAVSAGLIQLLLYAGLTCAALHLAGIGTRSYSRSRR